MTLSLYLTVSVCSPQRHELFLCTVPSTTPYYKVLNSTTLCFKVLLQYYPVPQSTTPLLQSTSPELQSTTPYYKALLQYFSVLQSATSGSASPRLLCTTKHYSSVLQSTTLFYKVRLQYYNVLLQYYSVLQRTTPVLLHSCSVLRLQYYSVLQSTTAVLQSTIPVLATPVLLCTTMYYSSTEKSYMTCHWHCEEQHRRHCPTSPNTVPATAPKNESHDWISSHIKGYLQCAQQQMSPSNLTKYCARQQKWLTCCILDTYEMLFTMCGATSVTLQPHQILRVPRKMTPTLDPRDIWNGNYKARSNRRHPSMSPNIVPATENDHPKFDTNLLKTGETSFTMRGRQSATRRATEVTFRARHAHLFMKNTTFRAPALFPNFTKYCACHEKWQWNFTKYCACHEKRHFNFPKHCACHKKCYLNFTKYCACQLNRLSSLIPMLGAPGATPMSPNTAPATENDRPKFDTNLLKTGETSFAMCGRSEIVPRMIRAWNRQSATRRATEVTFRARHAHLFMKIQHFALRLSFQISPSTAPATKSDSGTSPNTAPATINEASTSPCTALATKRYYTWALPSTPAATKSPTWASRSAAPATKSDNYYYLTLLLLDSTWLYYYLTIPFTWLYYYLTIPITWLYYYLTIPITWRFLSLDSAVISLYYYLTISILDESFHLTPLLFHSTINWRFLLLDSTVTWLCYVVRISEVSQPKLL